MFRSLVINKNNIKSYIIAILASFGTAQIGLAPFTIAALGSLIEQKIPILIPFIVSLLVTYIKFGVSAMVRLLVTIVIYALFKSVVKEKDSKYKNVLRLILSQLIASTFVILIGLEKLPNPLLLILEAIINAVLMLVFSSALNALLNLTKESKLKSEETISFSMLLTILFSGLAIYSFFGMTVFSIASIVILMITCWKKSIRFSVTASIFMAVLFMLVSGAPLIYLLLYLIAGISTALLSRAGRAGLLIGLVFTATYSIFFAPTKEKLYSNLGYSSYLMEDFKKFVNNPNNQITADDFSDDLITNIDSAMDEMVNTPYTIVFREMLIGFAIMLLIPNSAYDYLERITKEDKFEFEFLGNKKFGFYKIYLLNPAKEKVEEDKKEETKTKSKKSSNKPKAKSNDDKKTSKKKNNKTKKS